MTEEDEGNVSARIGELQRRNVDLGRIMAAHADGYISELEQRGYSKTEAIALYAGAIRFNFDVPTEDPG